jgi:hypothetical protein
LGSYSAIQGRLCKIRQLLWLIFRNFVQSFPILGNRTTYRASATSALSSALPSSTPARGLLFPFSQ